jgi:hypothetical protein
MSEFSVLGKFVNFDIETNGLSLKLLFLDPDTQKNIEKAVIDQKETKIVFKLKFNQSHKSKYQKIWYGSLALIAKSDNYKIIPIAENMDDLDNYLRESIFPVRKRFIDGAEIPRPARMQDLSDEELQQCMDRLHSRYSYLKINGQPIDFSDLKK